MRILIVSEDIPFPNMGGLAKHALNLARALVRAGHQVDLLGCDEHPIEVCGEEGKFGGRFFGELNGQHAGWKEISFGVFMPPKRPSIARHFARIIMRRARDYDVVHYHGHIPNVARYLPPDLNFVQTRHDQGGDCFRHTRFRDGAICDTTDPTECARCITPHPNVLQRAISKAAVVRFRREVAESFQAHKTVFVSDMLARNFARVAGPGPWGTTVHNFVNRSALEDIRRAAALLPAREGFHVFIAGKLYPAKGIEQFLRALAPRLPEQMHVTIAGDGPDEQRLRAEFGNGRIEFLGWCDADKTLSLAASANAVVVPSVWEEPCATTVLEGLFLGKPTFALRRGGTPELSIYAADPGQLRLHDNMQALVTDLITFDPATTFGYAAEGLGCADRAAQQLLEIYRLPARPSFR
ncbi:MAG TPA: glycosyltransferase family 4 protein [Noviherbaspirillum sp.]|uniref:glycosyltransferase family 4 protein n=1 Tax=Noviherbaspirillum sp. TaxID=1926288 RepID=UPI002D4CF105|nr:glycosyltransferase family 4 protein [Noviherbaspirillum sp.]HYD97616.1 glycosyltransferase family 4 protein [Noviherbaspirillum sp.]